MIITKADIALKDNVFALTGDIDFSNVMSVYQKSLGLINAGSTCLVFDFAGVNSSDSAGLALIVEWLKLSKHQQRQVRFINLSKDLTSIIKVAGLTNLLTQLETECS